MLEHGKLLLHNIGTQPFTNQQLLQGMSQLGRNKNFLHPDPHTQRGHDAQMHASLLLSCTGLLSELKQQMMLGWKQKSGYPFWPLISDFFVFQSSVLITVGHSVVFWIDIHVNIYSVTSYTNHIVDLMYRILSLTMVYEWCRRHLCSLTFYGSFSACLWGENCSRQTWLQTICYRQREERGLSVEPTRWMRGLSCVCLEIAQSARWTGCVI